MKEQFEKRKFTLDQNAISMLIQAQAGSLQKAILEAVSNALDAGASKVKVDLSPTRVVIEDDGRGFRSKQELEDFFERFGFDHSQLDRKVGRFGVGRGQLFHFGKNVWTTNQFTMRVDTRTDMFGYDLGIAETPHKGVRIEIDLYDELNFSQLNTTETELKKLVKFCTIPVVLNGKTISKDPTKVKWDAETDDAWFLLDDSHSMMVYSQGLFVQALGAYQFGKGGMVVTKMGRPLKQNMARNDTLTTDCDVWKRVRKTIDGLSASHRKKAKKSKTMTEALRTSLLISGLECSDVEGVEALLDTPLFTLTNGRHVKLSTLLSLGFVASSKNKDPAADLLMQREQAMVVSKATLSSAGVDSVADLRDKIRVALKRAKSITNVRAYDVKMYELNTKIYKLSQLEKGCSFFETVDDLPMTANVEIVDVKDKEATKDERLALSIIRRELLPQLTCIVSSKLDSGFEWNSWNIPKNHIRSLQLAVSEAFVACTDGSSKIWVDRNFLGKCMERGLSGFMELSHTLVHELLHDNDTSTGHDHDHDFYQAFHDIALDHRVTSIGFKCFRSWVARGGKVSALHIKELERSDLMTSDVVESRREALSDPANAARLVAQELGDNEIISKEPGRKRKP